LALEQNTMASTPLGEDNYPDPMLDSGRSAPGLWRVVVLGLLLVGGAVVFTLFNEQIPPELVMTFVGRRFFPVRPGGGTFPVCDQ
jgi:two-component system cell cycle sensor histidine kinase/response regulator CckA